MAGSAPVDSPTSIISTDISGKTLVSSRLWANPWPSRTPRVAVSMPCEIRRLCIDSHAVSSDGTSDSPPDSKVDSIRVNTATWYFNQTSPNSGIFNLIRSTLVAPLSLFIQRHRKNPIATSTARESRKYFFALTPIASITEVTAGSGEPNC